ncbi:hypothetical protein J7E70_04070 [Variovorax paradoxus]|nr:class I SAM-dependent methyltransferase [Variovorax paradoxus]MBT2299634.1 hypothetical protein [Variovorax paradoxus]
MGIGLHEFNFLRYSKQQRDFDQTVTIGRQELHVPDSNVRDAFALSSEYKNDKYCDQLLRDQFGAGQVDSIDFSEYEEASIVHDMNLPLPENVAQRYDTVIDGGCLEHIFNVPQALLNCSKFCKPGAQILHMLPASNCCGHGFWQFSPELFFSLYSDKNGYSDTEVFLADLSKPSKWFRVKPPAPGERINVHSISEAYVLVRTVLKENNFNHSGVQQSDYAFEWENGAPASERVDEPSPRGGIARFLKRFPLLHKVVASAYHMYRPADSMLQLSLHNPHLEELPVSSLTRGAAD